MMNGLFPWKLNEKAIKKQYEVNEAFRAQSNLEIVMRETFDFDMESHKEPVSYDRPGIQNSDVLFKISDIIGNQGVRLLKSCNHKLSATRGENTDLFGLMNLSR